MRKALALKVGFMCFLIGALSIKAEPALETVSNVELSRYAGTWYEIARFPFKQQEGCHDTTATYSLNSDGTIKVVNRCRKGGFDAPVSTAIATAKVVDQSTRAKLKVKFFVLAPWADYWIIRLGADYDHAVVSQPGRKYLWILSRTPQMEPALYADILQELKARGFDTDRLERTPQDGENPAEASVGVGPLLLPYLHSFGLALLFMTLVWLLSLVLKDASIVDRFWGLGFIVLAMQQLFESRFLTFRAGLVFILVLIWGLRLSLHIHFRNKGKPEDPRYREMRKVRWNSFWWKSYFIVFVLQGIIMAVVSAPLAFVPLFPQSDVPTLLDAVGCLIWAVGFFFEAVSDFQLSRFKRNPAHKGTVLRSGLWALSRHPNYFGESLIWWGYFLIALNVDYGWVTLYSPLLMTYLLLRISGVRLLENQLKSTKPEYAAYIQDVPAFFPRMGKPSRSIPGKE